MRAVTYREYGDPSVLTVEDLAAPHAGPGQVRIRVQAASVNPMDWKFRAGYLAQMMPVTFPAVPGMDAAGVVDEVGEGVSGTALGDAVFGLTAGGATAEQALLVAWAPIPEGWSVEQAAGAGVAATTAIRVLDLLGVKDGTTLLIEGAAGGVGSAAAQIALARGATVIGTASQPKHDFLRSLGVIPTTYGPGLPERVAALAPGGVNAALDTAGSGSLADLVAIVGDPHAVVSIADINAPTLGARLDTGSTGAPADALAQAAQLGAAGKYTPHVEATYPLERTAEAHAHSQGGHTQGKIIVTV
jgi:NADPH:quinone reductase-like Zn-dependent oxidoreductase